MKYGFMSSELVSWLYEHDKMMRGNVQKSCSLISELYFILQLLRVRCAVLHSNRNKLHHSVTSFQPLIR